VRTEDTTNGVADLTVRTHRSPSNPFLYTFRWQEPVGYDACDGSDDKLIRCRVHEMKFVHPSSAHQWAALKQRQLKQQYA